MSEEDIYGYSHRLELALTGQHGIKRSKLISKVNKETLFKYHTYLKTRSLSLPRQEKLMKALKRLAELLGDKPFIAQKAFDIGRPRLTFTYQHAGHTERRL